MTVVKHPTGPIPSVTGQSGNLLSTNGSELVWSAPGASGSMTFLASGTLSGSSVALNSIPGTYKNLYLVIESATSSGDGPITLRYNGNSSNYLNIEARNRGGTASTISPGTDGVRMATFLDTGGGTSTDMQLVYTIFDYANTTSFKTTNISFSASDSDTTQYTGFVTSAFRQTGAITSMTINNNGETFSGGTYVLYGVR